MKIVRMLQSRKFWASLLGVVVSLGLVAWSDAQQAELVGAILTIVSTVSYTLGVALEDGLTAQAEATVQAAMTQAAAAPRVGSHG